MIETHRIKINPYFVPKSDVIILNASINAEENKIRDIVFDIEQISQDSKNPYLLRPPKIKADLPDILERVLIFYGVSLKQVLGPTRKGKIMKARNMFCAVAKIKTNHSYRTIAMVVNRDGGSARNACSTITKSQKKALDGDTTYRELQRICGLFKNTQFDE